jgi:hypothetical protein
MSLAIAPKHLPWSEDAVGVVRVGRTRVTLQTVVEAFNDGCAAEEMAAQYPSPLIAFIRRRPCRRHRNPPQGPHPRRD